MKLACTIIRHDLIDLARRENAPFRTASPLDASTEPISIVEDGEEMAGWVEFHKAVGHLPDEERQVFELHYYQGMKLAAIARLLSREPRTVSRIYVRAEGRLADWMERAGFR